MLNDDVLVSVKTFLFWRKEKEVYYASKKWNLEANLVFFFQYMQRKEISMSTLNFSENKKSFLKHNEQA